MTLAFIISWFLLMFPIYITPGPANIVCATVGMRQGFIKGIPFLIGLDLIILLYTLLIGFGLGQFILAFPQVLIVMQYIGTAYLLYLSYKLYKSRSIKSLGEEKTYGFKEGIILSLVNPKVITALFMMFSIFLVNDTNVTKQVLFLTFLSTLVNIPCHIVWVLMGQSITKLFQHHPNYQKNINIAFSVILVGVAVWLLLV